MRIPNLNTLKQTVLPLALLLTLSMAGCPEATPPGDGGSDGDPSGGSTAQVTGKRLIGTTTHGIVTYRLDGSLSGDVEPDMQLNADGSCFSGVLDMAINGAGELLVLSTGNGDCSVGPESGFRINVYADATRLDGNQQPARIAETADISTDTGSGARMVIDVERDVLYVVSAFRVEGTRRSAILAYENTSQAGFDGPVSPARMFSIAGIGTTIPSRPILAEDDTMYLPANRIYRIPNVSTVDGELTESEFADASFGGSLSTPVSHVDDMGRFYFLRTNTSTLVDTSTSGTIRQYTSDTHALERTAIISSVGFPDLLGVASDGMIYVGAGNLTGVELRVYNPIENVVQDVPFEPIRVANGVGFYHTSRYRVLIAE